MQNNNEITPRMKLMSALFYAVTSISIMFSNKIVLTSYGFPSVQVLAAAQFTITITFLTAAKMCGLLTFPDVSCSNIKKIFPLPIFFFLNCMFGLGGTKNLSLPMFTVLRRFSILITMCCEICILGYAHSTKIKCAVGAMILGAAIAAVKDLSFNMWGYSMVMANNCFTAANSITMKVKLDSKDFGRFGLLFYNSLASLAMLLVFIAAFQRDKVVALKDFEYWGDPVFVIFFSLSSVLGFLLNYTIYLALEYTSPLTVTVIGCLKNIVTAVAGMFMHDYVFEPTNFGGIAFSLVASLYYSAQKLMERNHDGAELLPQEDPDDDWSDDDDFALKDEEDSNASTQ